MHALVQKRALLVNVNAELHQVVLAKVLGPIVIREIINVSALRVWRHAPILENRVPRVLANAELLQRVSGKHLGLTAMLQTMFANALQLLLLAVGQLIRVPQEYANVVVMTHVVTQVKLAALELANAELPQPVSGRHRVLSVMQQTMYVNARQQ